MKKQCLRCKKWFDRIDLWKVDKSWLGNKYVCRTCRRSYVREDEPSGKNSNVFGAKKCPNCGKTMSEEKVWHGKEGFLDEWICLKCNFQDNKQNKKFENSKEKLRNFTGLQREKIHEKTKEELEAEKAEEGRIYAEFSRKEKENSDRKSKDLVVRHIDAGNKFFSYRKFNEALSCYNEALLIEPDNIRALISKGDTLRTLGKDTEAILCYDKVLEIEPNNKDAILGKETSLFKLSKDGTGEEKGWKSTQREDKKSTQEDRKGTREEPIQHGFDPYAVLGLNRNVTAVELKARFRDLIKKNNLAGSINMSTQERERKEAVIKDIIKAKEMISKEKGFSS